MHMCMCDMSRVHPGGLLQFQWLFMCCAAAMHVLLQSSVWLSDLTDTLRQSCTDEVNIVLWQAVQDHQVPSCHMVADQHMALRWNYILVFPCDAQPQHLLQYCSMIKSEHYATSSKLVPASLSMGIPEIARLLSVSHGKSAASSTTQSAMRMLASSTPASRTISSCFVCLPKQPTAVQADLPNGKYSKKAGLTSCTCLASKICRGLGTEDFWSTVATALIGCADSLTTRHVLTRWDAEWQCRRAQDRCPPAFRLKPLPLPCSRYC